MVFGTKTQGPTTTPLSHTITGRHFKFVPKIWQNGGWACLRLEMYGCSPDIGM